jgi:CRISPR-associated protein Csm1
MEQKKIDLCNGALLHDIGKLIYRHNDQRRHQETGYEFLKEANMNKAVLDQVRYHHAAQLKSASLSKDNLAYITYYADNISAGIDRRKQEDGAYGFDRHAKLDSIFNILNQNDAQLCYDQIEFDDLKIQYPVSHGKGMNEAHYGKILTRIKEHITKDVHEKEYVNSTLQLLEAVWSYIPSSTSTQERKDISLYDHSKLTACIALALYDYFDHNKIDDYKDALFSYNTSMDTNECFLLISMDLSGIQKFIYTIASKGALKGLRSRSFYLDILLEYMNDLLLNRLSLFRSNLLYSGGGHSYLLVANTEKTKEIIQDFHKDMNDWLIELFDIDLYLGLGFAHCSPNSLKNIPEGSYQQIFREASHRVSESKVNRYPLTILQQLNEEPMEERSRECIVCQRTDRLDEENHCSLCRRIEKMSASILKEEFFTVSKDQQSESGLPLPEGRALQTEKDYRLQIADIQKDKEPIYTKNRRYMGRSVATPIWVGDYHSADTFGELANKAHGVKRLGVLRADVDNMGESFISGFVRNNETKYQTLSRTSMLSRLVSEYFKKHINSLLREGAFHLDGTNTKRPRNAAVVYAGGDDLFITGAWDDIIGFSIDLYLSFKDFTIGSMTVSGGIGLFPPKYPIAAMAEEVGRLEDRAKQMDGKNSIALFSKDHVYTWPVFVEDVIGRHYQTLQTYFMNTDQANNEQRTALLYRIYALIVKRDQPIYIARMAYLLGRLRPVSKNNDLLERHENFSKELYRIVRDDVESKKMATAILLYVYMHRKD